MLVGNDKARLTFTCSNSTIETLEKRCEICSKLTIKTPEPRHWRRSSVFIVDFEHISYLFSSVSIVNFEQVNVSWEMWSSSYLATEFGLTATRDSYFTILIVVFTNHILTEYTYFTNRIERTEHSIMVLILSNKYQIILQCYYFKNIIADDHPFFFSKSKITNWKDEIINYSNIYYYLIYGARKTFRKSMLEKEFWFFL